MISASSLRAAIPAGSELSFCSARLGWRSVLLRGYKDARIVETYETTPTADQKIVLVTAGSCRIEARRRGVWHAADYRPGHIGLVPPGEAAQLRWRGKEHHHNLQFHLPGAMIESVAGELFGEGRRPDPLRHLSLIDPVVAATVLALERAARAGAPDIHAETTAHFLASHLLLRGSPFDPRPTAASDRSSLDRVEEYMRARLSELMTLGELAGVAGIGRFQLLRMAKRVWGETPQRRLTRLRMQRAERLLMAKHLTIIEIAFECGYGNPAHFATASDAGPVCRRPSSRGTAKTSSGGRRARLEGCAIPRSIAIARKTAPGCIGQFPARTRPSRRSERQETPMPDRQAAIVTGSSQGIGAAVAERLARDGFAVTINYSGNAAPAEELAGRINSANGRAIAVKADVSDAAAVARLFDETERAFGGVDALVNNAGIMKLAPLAEFSDELFDRHVAVNLKGVFNSLREGARRIRDGGRIVSFSSSVVGLYQPTYGVYAATKAGVEAMTHILAKELGARKITVNAVAPGPVATQLFLGDKSEEQVKHIGGMIPLGRLAEPNDIASVVSFLVGPDGAWVSGQVLRANGGVL